jgi:hypothetical protein
MRAPIFRGHCDDGVHLVLDRREAFKEYLKTFKGKKFDLILRERTVERSDAANRYYRGVVVPMIAKEMGHPKNEEDFVHDMLKKQFGITSTTKLTAIQFQEYITGIVQFAAEKLNLPIPDPESVDY